MEIQEEIRKRSLEIEAGIKKYLPKEEGNQKKLMEAMNYSILSGGKRLRPMLIQETYYLFGGKEKSVILPFMAAMEMIHTYSLVHDDLPAMDNDQFRRGRKTTHVVYGEAMGILAGDALLNFAFETVLNSFSMDGNIKNFIQALSILAKKAGAYGMIGGQAVDMEEENAVMNQEKLSFIYHLKTGALIEASMLIGAVLAGGKREELETVERIAAKVGQAFQIQDDILDVTSSMDVLGKPVYSDEKNHKVTYVTLNGLEKSRQEVCGLSKEALREFDYLPYQNEFLRGLIVTLINRKN